MRQSQPGSDPNPTKAWQSRTAVYTCCLLVLLVSLSHVAAQAPHWLEARDVGTAHLRLKPIYVLSKQRVGVLVDPTSVAPDLIALADYATVTMHEAGTRHEVGVEAVQRRLQPLPATPFEMLFDAPAAGAQVRFEGALHLTDGTILAHAVPYTVPETPAWFGAYEVPDDFVPHPWPALRIEDGTTVVCWGRSYVFGASPFPQQILVAGENILTGPVQLDLLTSRGALTWQDEPVRVVSQNPGQVVLERAGTAPGVRVLVQTTIDFDGFVAFDVQLTPTATVQLDEIAVRIPVRHDVGRFFHVDGGWRELRWGAVAQRDSFPVLATERYYYWVGNDDAGLSWMTDRTAHWQAAAPGELRTGFRHNDAGLEGFFQVWSRRATLDKPMRLRLALEATPTRPENGRPVRAFTSHNTPPDNFRQPRPKDKDTILEMSLYGKFNFPPYAEDADKIGRWISEYARRGVRVLGYMYVSSEVSTDAYHDFGGDFEATTPPIPHARIGGERGTAWSFSCHNSAWSDYYLHAVDRTTTEYETDGIYLDGIMQERMCERPQAHGPDCDQTWPLFASREHVKKLLYVVQKNRGRDAFLWGHSSDNKLAPFAGLMDLLYEGENYGGAIPYRHLTTDVMRAQFGKQFGPRTVYIPQLKREDIPADRLLGMLALHDVECPPRGMSVGAIDTLLHPLWETLDAFPSTTAQFVPYYRQTVFRDATGLPVSAYINPTGDRFLLVLANQSPRAVTYQIQYHPEDYRGYSRMRRVQEHMAGQRVRSTERHIDLTLNAWAVRLVEVHLQ